jgi:hypothetical protein
LLLGSVLPFVIASGCGGGGDGDGSGGSSAFGGSSAAGGSSATGGSGGTIGVGGSSGTINVDGGGASGGFNPDSGCAAATVQGTLIPANLMFVIDRSGSMNCNLPSDGQSTAECENFPTKKFPALASKWELTRDALKLAFDDLTTSGNSSAGLDMFPNEGSECLVDQTPNISIQTLDATHNTTLDTFLDNVNPQGKTPIAGATILSYAHLYEQIQQNALVGNKFVVLLTDGFETCKPEELPKLLSQDIPNANNQLGIKTFVIGVPGSEDGRALLSQMAFIGGTAKTTSCVHDPAPNNVGDCHYDMTTSANFGQDLVDALKAISGTVLSCELDMPQPSGGGLPDYNGVKVWVDGNEATPQQGQDCSQSNGWQYNADKTKILLCGSACDDAKQPNAKVEIYVPCGIT